MSDDQLRAWLQRQLDRAAWAGAWGLYATIAGYLATLDGYGTRDIRRDCQEVLT